MSNVKITEAGIIADASVKEIESAITKVETEIAESVKKITSLKEQERKEFEDLKAEVSSLRGFVHGLQHQTEDLNGRID